jgi:hypothetical protein
MQILSETRVGQIVWETKARANSVRKIGVGQILPETRVGQIVWETRARANSVRKIGVGQILPETRGRANSVRN